MKADLIQRLQAALDDEEFNLDADEETTPVFVTSVVPVVTKVVTPPPVVVAAAHITTATTSSTISEVAKTGDKEDVKASRAARFGIAIVSFLNIYR